MGRATVRRRRPSRFSTVQRMSVRDKPFRSVFGAKRTNLIANPSLGLGTTRGPIPATTVIVIPTVATPIFFPIRRDGRAGLLSWRPPGPWIRSMLEDHVPVFLPGVRGVARVDDEQVPARAA